MFCAKPKAYCWVGEPSYIVGLLAGHSVSISKSDWLKQQFHCDSFKATGACTLDSEGPKEGFLYIGNT